MQLTATHSIALNLLVTIDISKHRHELLIGIPGKKRRRQLTITDTLEDSQRLSATLASYNLPVRISKQKAVTATARKIAVLFYTTLRFGMSYRDSRATAYEERHRCRVLANLQRRAKTLGYSLAPHARRPACFLGNL